MSDYYQDIMDPPDKYQDLYDLLMRAPKRSRPELFNARFTLVDSYIQCYTAVEDSIRLYRQSQKLLLLASITKYSQLVIQRMQDIVERLPDQIKKMDEASLKVMNLGAASDDDNEEEEEGEEEEEEFSADEKECATDVLGSPWVLDLTDLYKHEVLAAKALQIVRGAKGSERKPKT